MKENGDTNSQSQSQKVIELQSDYGRRYNMQHHTSFLADKKKSANANITISSKVKYPLPLPSPSSKEQK